MSVSYNVPEIKAQLLLNLRSCLSYLFPNGTFHGDEFRIGDVHGNKGQSLRVELSGSRAGLWNDFATGEGGDIIDLWAAVHRKNARTEFPEVMASISEWLGNNKKYREYVDEDFEKFITQSWNYYDENGQVIVKVYRSDPPGKKKVYKPFDVKRGRYGSPGIRPIYNIPGILKSDKIVLVEGEKCAEVLIEKGITATTAMSGANAPIEKTDWTPLKGKHIIIWPDNDEAGNKYAKNAEEKLLEIGVESLVVLNIPQNKTKGWDAADCVEEGINVKEFLASTALTTNTLSTKSLISFSARQYFNDKSPMPEDIVAPRILTPSGLLVFAGAPKVGKSDFLISWLIYMAAGVSFLGMTPSKPMKIFYLQTEIEYEYMKERLQQLQLDNELLNIAANNLIITPRVQLSFTSEEIDEIKNVIKERFKPDIIAIDRVSREGKYVQWEVDPPG